MKKITLWLFALFTCWQISAQTTVTIGSGTSSATGGTNGNPIYRSSAGSTFNFSQSIQLLTAADLAAAGVTSGATITKIAFYKNDAFTMSAGRTATMNIYLKNSSATALTTASNFATWTTGSTNCYSNAAIGPANFPAAAGWVEYTLTTPFNYSGGAIETAIDWAINPGAGNATTGAFSWLYTASTAIQAVGTSNSAAITGNLTTSQLRQYNTQITFTTTPCTGTPTPGNTIVPSPICTGSSATLSLQNATVGSGVTYQWYMNGLAISGANSGVYVIPSVTSTNNYYCEVTCGGNTGVSSTVAVGPTILTAPTAVETFTTYLPSCWLFGDNGDLAAGPATFGTNSWKNDGFANSGATGSIAYNHYTTGANDWIISPVINIPASGYELKFDAALTQWNGTTAPTTPWDAGDVLEVLVSTTGLDNWSVLYTIDNANPPAAAGSAIAIDLDAYASQNVRFAYRVVSGATDGTDDTDIFIDNFTVRLSPTCPDQTGLVVGGVTAFGANTSWDDLSGSGAIGYEYAITTSATPPASGTAIATTFYVASGLTPQTVYYLHVRSSCTAGLFGNWASISFTTGCAPITTLPHLEPFNTFLPNACWLNGVNGDLTTGPAAFTASGWGADGLANAGTTGAIRNNIFTTGANDWVISPQFTIPSTGYELKFDAAAVQYAGTTAPTTPWESDDSIEVLVSSTGTSNWTAIYTYNDTNQPGITATPNAIDLDAYSGQTVRFAFRAVEGATDGSADIDFSIDNFEVRLSPTCPDQTGLVVGSVTATGASTSWDDLSAGGALGYEYAITTSATPPASGTATTSTFYIASGLSPQTVYYLHVRATCSAGTFGNWASTTFTTACAPVTVLPWNEGFESLVTVGTTNFPSCWFKENGDWSSQNTNGTYSTANTGTNYIRDSWSATNEYIWTPGFNLVAGTSYDFSSFVQGDNGTGWVVDYFVNTVQNSTGATQVGASYNVPGAGTPYAFQPYALVKRSFVPSTTGTYYFAVRVNQPSGGPWYVSFDDFKLELSPACPTPSASVSSITDSSASITWSAVPSATLGYEYVLDNVATDPAGSGTSTTSTTYSASGLTPTTVYYFHIRSVCSVGTYSTWSTITFTTLATPPVNDNCSGALVLTPGPLYTSNPVATSNVGATNSNPPAPGCAAFSGGDVWFSVVVPASGNISLETITGTITDTGLAVYSGTCAGLTLVDCDDDSAANAGSNSFIALTGRTPGEVLYVNAWDYSNNDVGTFSVTAYDASLSASTFDKSSFVAYPNPVKDVLHLSYSSVINNVRIVNLLGQEVLNTKSNANDVQVNMSGLTAGAYIVNITVEDTVHTIKVIKE